jgi:hypothetical protein
VFARDSGGRGLAWDSIWPTWSPPLHPGPAWRCLARQTAAGIDSPRDDRSDEQPPETAVVPGRLPPSAAPSQSPFRRAAPSSGICARPEELRQSRSGRACGCRSTGDCRRGPLSRLADSGVASKRLADPRRDLRPLAEDQIRGAKLTIARCVPPDRNRPIWGVG